MLTGRAQDLAHVRTSGQILLCPALQLQAEGVVALLVAGQM